MNQVEIRQTIDKNNKMIKEFMSPNFFSLNNTVFELLQENHKLQEICSHKFEDGYCIFCDKMEETSNE